MSLACAPGGFWETRHEALERLAAENFSAAEIARRLGAGCTRNMVIGRAWRTGVVLRSTATNTAQAKAGQASAEARRLNPIHRPQGCHRSAAA